MGGVNTGGMAVHGRHLIVVGPMGVGKSTTAIGLAARLGRQHRDGDATLEARMGMTGREIAARDGVDHLHELEEQILLDLLAETERLVISPAASVVASPTCRAALEPPVVVVLALDEERLAVRRAGGDHRRAMTRAESEALDRRRAPWLVEVADITVDAGQPPDAVVAEAMAHLDWGDSDSPAGPPPSPQPG